MTPSYAVVDLDITRVRLWTYERVIWSGGRAAGARDQATDGSNARAPHLGVARRARQIAMSVANRGTTEYLISPTHYVTGHGATQLVGSVAGRYGARAMLVHGAVGYPLVEDVVASSLAGAALAVTTAGHAGPCTQEAVEAHAQAARSFSAEVVVGIGGGRVLDTAKGVAEAINRSCVTVPTSPATCAATTAAVVYYDSALRLRREPPAS